MKKLTGAFNDNKNKKKSTALTNVVKAVETTPRKINEEDYKKIRLYAFENELTMLETTTLIQEEIKKYFTINNPINFTLDKEIYHSENQKSIRISKELNEKLKELSIISEVPSKYIFSFFVNEYLQ